MNEKKIIKRVKPSQHYYSYDCWFIARNGYDIEFADGGTCTVSCGWIEDPSERDGSAYLGINSCNVSSCGEDDCAFLDTICEEICSKVDYEFDEDEDGCPAPDIDDDEVDKILKFLDFKLRYMLAGNMELDDYDKCFD